MIPAKREYGKGNKTRSIAINIPPNEDRDNNRSLRLILRPVRIRIGM